MTRKAHRRTGRPARSRGARATRWTGISVAVPIVAAILAIATVALVVALGTAHHASPVAAAPAQRLAPAATLGALASAGDPGRLGPEGVPIPPGPSLAPAGSLAAGQSVDGISSEPLEQVAFHIHARLTIFVAGAPRAVPLAIGITPPLQLQSTPAGPFAGGAAFAWLHTHAADGIIHVESPTQRIYTLEDFFGIWGQPLAPDRVGPAVGPVTAFLNGQRYVGDPRQIPLLAHEQIQLDVGRPIVAPLSIRFPPNL